MNKHAYLIIAHDKYEQLQFLVSLLDDLRNDIYIHIDKKSPLPTGIKASRSKIFIIPDNERVDVRWGDVSQIQCELKLYESAYKSAEKYAYYHLLSGICLPIKPINRIYSFFELHSGKNFIGFGQYGEINYINRISKRHYFTKSYRDKSKFKRIIMKISRIFVEFVLNIILPSKVNRALVYKKGANWCSLTNDFVEYMIAQKDSILDHYKRSYCADEMYKQTLIWNSDFNETIYDKTNEFVGCLRFIDWNRGLPYILGADENEDYEMIKESPCLFARKFDMVLYPSMVQKIKELVCEK